MRRAVVLTLALSVLTPSVARPAFAHGFGQSYDLPLQLWLYLYGAAAVVILMLAADAYDGLLATPVWLEIVRLTPLTQTLGIIVIPVLLLAVYLGFVKLG